ncbi:MAG: hypothetical protein MJ252_00920 [archaeon]|nr:hypothetical protein [archaeon]
MKYLLFFTLLFFIKYSFEFTVIAQSSLDTCLKNDTSNGTVTGCKKKIVFSITIENSELADTDHIYASLNEIVGEDGLTYGTKDPYYIKVTKSQVNVLYPTTYLTDVNYHPQELIYQTGKYDCKDSDGDSNPTCGWQRDDNGRIIPDSQGFCCECSFSQLIGLDKSTKRGDECELTSFFSGASTAHCLVYGKLWCSVYEIHQYRYDYTIKITIQNENNSTDKYTITLTPSDTIGKTKDGRIMAKIVGDFLPLNPPETFSQYYLVVPSQPKNNAMVIKGTSSWMLIRSDQFTLDGSGCNKIGIGYNGFRRQNEKCDVGVGTCLFNQLYEYYDSDMERIKKDLNPEHLVIKDPSKEYVFKTEKDGNRLFGYKLNGHMNTLVNMELDADTIQVEINLSKAVINLAEIDNFEAMTNEGDLHILVTNIGVLTSSYHLAYECNDNIMPIEESHFSLKQMKTENLFLKVYSTSDNGMENECNITLKNAIGEIIDFKLVQFNTTDSKKKNNQNNTFNTEDPTGNNYQNAQILTLTCSNYCPDVFSFLCFFAHSCWGYLLRDVILILVPIFILYYIIYHLLWKKFCLDKIICCGCCKKKKKSNKENCLDEVEEDA